MSSALITRVRETVERYRMTHPGDRVGLAVSGGGDSVALLFLFEQLREALGVTLAVLHFNHRLRGEAAEQDEQFVRELAGERGLPFLVRREEIGAEARRSGRNVEELARERRYAFFRELAAGGRVTCIATGHTGDDQAETVLGRMVRGSGLRGLAGIRPVLGPVVRPLLGARRRELRDYLRERGLAWREDETNADRARLRARIRHGVMPSLEEEFGAGIVNGLARLAGLARQDEALIEEIVDQHFARLVRRRGNELVLRARDLVDPGSGLGSRAAREALAARLARRAAREAKRDLRGLAASHIDRVLVLARRGKSGDRLELPGGLVVERVLDDLVFGMRSVRGRITAQQVAYCHTADPGEAGEAIVEIAERGKRIRLKLIDWPADGRDTCQEASAALDADRLGSPLLVRNWRPGDAYRPSGRGHREKLKRLLLERRVAGRDRVCWPVLTSAGELVWASGLPAAKEFAAQAGTRRALVVFEEPVGSPDGWVSQPGFIEASGRRPASNYKDGAVGSGRGGVSAGPVRGRT